MLLRLFVLGLLVALPGVARAQLNPIDNGNSNRGTGLRDRFSSATSKPAAKAKLDEALRNFNSDDEATRLEGVGQLGNVEDEPKAIGYLLQGANDPDSAIRLKSIDVLGQVRAKDAVAPLVQQLFMRDTEPVTKQHLLVALGKIGDPKATKPILDFLARDGDRAIRGNAIFALGDIGDQAALEPLQHIADGNDAALRTRGAERGPQDPRASRARGRAIGAGPGAPARPGRRRQRPRRRHTLRRSGLASR